MKKVYIGILLIIVLSGLWVGSFFVFPKFYLNLYLDHQSNNAGLVRKNITLKDQVLTYYETEKENTKEPLVLMHPLGDNMTGFFPLAQSLSETYHIIIPELPINNIDSIDNKEDVIDILNTVHDFLNKKNIPKAHWLGASFGGQLATMYAILFPDQVNTLTLIGTTGVDTAHVLPQNPITEHDLEATMQPYTMSTHILSPFKGYYTSVLNERIEKYSKWQKFLNKDTPVQLLNLSNQLQKVEAPTLVIWPKEDHIVTYETADWIAKHLPVSKFVPINDAAHYAYRDQPDEIAKTLVDFIASSKPLLLNYTGETQMLKSQLYRWIQFFEEPKNSKRRKNHLETVIDYVEANAARAVYGGKPAYIEKMVYIIGGRTPTKMMIKNLVIKPSVTDDYFVNFNLHKQINKDSYLIDQVFLTYDGQTKPSSVLKKVNIATLGVVKIDDTHPPLEDNYVKHRINSLIHQWFFLFEQSFKHKKLYKKIIANNPSIDLRLPIKGGQNQVVHTLDDLIKYLEEFGQQFPVSSDIMLSMDFDETSKNQYTVKTKVAWRGVSKEDELWLNNFLITWKIEDNPDEPYATIKSLEMFALAPPRPLL